MGFEGGLEKTFGMSDQVWQRHANPWSVWTRYTALPLLVVAFWSRVWLGGWSLVPILAAALWTWLNPRVFPRPVSTRNWASMGVLGERVWLNQKAIPIPAHHQRALRILSIVTGLGVPPVVYGVICLDVPITLLGLCVVILGKSWLLDRTVWLFEDMRKKHPEYQDWLY